MHIGNRRAVGLIERDPHSIKSETVPDAEWLLADACEAIIGAIYLDAGLDAARHFVERHWSALVAADALPPQDAKTALQEWAQARALPPPDYVELSREGPDHQPLFTVEVRLAVPQAER